ncbi:MAG: hypothetical protein PHT54_03525 [Candidatus Nanoarchaeia archaeon]|nr:hypothetical protein [Candidatus Nanoarchaeia archaeon]
MELKSSDISITINNNDDKAKKIMTGYSWEFENGKINILNKKSNYDISNFESKLNSGTQTNSDITDFLKEVIKIYKEIKWNIK